MFRFSGRDVHALQDTVKNIGKLSLATAFIAGSLFMAHAYADTTSMSLSPDQVEDLREWLEDDNADRNLSRAQRDALREAARDIVAQEDARRQYGYGAYQQGNPYYGNPQAQSVPSDIQNRIRAALGLPGAQTYPQVNPYSANPVNTGVLNNPAAGAILQQVLQNIPF